MRRLRRARHRRVHDEARANKGRGKKLLWSLSGFSISRGTATRQFVQWHIFFVNCLVAIQKRVLMTRMLYPTQTPAYARL